MGFESESFSKRKHCIPVGEETCKGLWIKMYSPPCFANSVSQISNNTGSLQHHRGLSYGLLREDIKGAAEKKTGVRVSPQTQTVRSSCWILLSVLPVRWKHCVALHLPAVQNPQSEDCGHPAPLITARHLLSALRCKCKWHISPG